MADNATRVETIHAFVNERLFLHTLFFPLFDFGYAWDSCGFTISGAGIAGIRHRFG